MKCLLPLGRVHIKWCRKEQAWDGEKLCSCQRVKTVKDWGLLLLQDPQRTVLGRAPLVAPFVVPGSSTTCQKPIPSWKMFLKR